MDQYEKMYYKLFNKVTVIISELQTAQQEMEEIFISQTRDIQTQNEIKDED